MSTSVIRSNREAGDGRYDILIKSMDEEKPAIIMELKAAATFTQMDAAAEKALNQIEARGYDSELSQEGYSSFIRYGIALYKKRYRIVSETKTL